MNVNKRDGREDTGAKRDVEQRTPRSGGRIAEERTRRTAGGRPASPAGGMPVQPATRGRTTRAADGGQPVPKRVDRTRGAYDYPTRGNAALRPQERAEAERSLRVWDSSEEEDRSANPAATSPERGGARLRVAPPQPVSAPRAPFVALILVLVVGGVLGILVVNTKINENSFRWGELQQEQAALDLQEQELKQQIAAAEAPGNLVAEARKLGLVDSGPPAFIRLPDGRLIGVPQPAGGQPAITSQQAGG